MRLFLLSIVIPIFLLMASYPAARDDSGGGRWRAWLHDGDGHMALVDASGTVLRKIDLPRPDALPEVSSPVVASGGDLITYIAHSPGGSRQQRMVYNGIDGALLELENRNPDSTFFTGSGTAAFDPTGRLLAYSSDAWYVRVIDAYTGSIRYQLDATSSGLPEQFGDYGAIKPVVWRFAHMRIWFRVHFDLQTNLSRNYVWDIGTGSITESMAYTAAPADTFAPTGETLSLDYDPQTGEVRVMVYDPLLGGRFTFYANAELELIDSDLRFVQNGQLVLYHGRAHPVDLWLLLERDGSLAGLLRHADRRTIFGTAEGFVYTLIDDGATELVDVDTGSFFSDRVVWHADGEWQIVWVDSGADAYGPFKQWAMLDKPVYDAPEVFVPVTPTPLPPGPQLLNPGMEVYVITNGDVLYLRDKPGTGGAILLYLYDRDRVTLLEGPLEVDGFRWWRVRAADGIEGWAAEASGDVSTLLPETPEPPRITPTPTPES